MNTKVLAVLLFILSAVSGLAENRGGLAVYAAMSPAYPCQTITQGFGGVDTMRLAVLWNTFGKSTKCIDQWANDSRPKLLETHLVNEVCHRNGRCGPYELLSGLSLKDYRSKLAASDPALLTRIKEYSRPMAEWYGGHPSVECRVTAGLESNLDQNSYKNLVSALKPIFPDRCVWGWNPVSNNAFGHSPIAGMFYEEHGVSPKLKPPCVSNLDGVDINFPHRAAIVPQSVGYSMLPRYLASFASCDASFLWIAEFNGVGAGAFIDPRSRGNWPASGIMAQLSQTLKESGQPPAGDSYNASDLKGCKRFNLPSDGVKKGFLWKQSDVSLYGAVAIFPSKTRYSSVVVRKNGQVFDTLKYAYQYTEDRSDRQVWRSNKKTTDFPSFVILKADSDCWKIPDPTTRND